MTTMNAQGIRNLGTALLGALALTVAGTAQADVKPYDWVPQDQAEAITTPEHLISVVQSGAPTAIWQALEHAEVVECLECISYVAPLLYDVNARNREIAAWWLRRRILGVFGPGEVYSQTLNTLATGDATNRAYAASAIGEFLVVTGIAPLAKAVVGDSDPGVRAAAASALGRINDDGTGAPGYTATGPSPLAQAFSDPDATVRAAAYVAASRINSFTDVKTAVAVTGDSDPIVRRVGIELLDEMEASDAAAALLHVAQSDPVDEVRLVACHALGNVGAASTLDVNQLVSALNDIAQNDSSMQVQDQARIASLRLAQ
jgi:hypothetical protein